MYFMKIQEWTLKRKLNPEVYGSPESAITKESIELEIGGFMTVEEAVEQKKLFILDYHDLLLPYVNKVNELKGTVIYGSRTLFFLTPDGTLRPLAIELTRPPVDDKPQWKQVYVPNTWNATGAWLWKLAKAHVLVHDSGYHQLVSHWLRTHCATEPYIIATNRQLSAMHPIYRLLYPHFRYTMKINTLAREALINTNGIIETSFFPGKYAMELSSFAYDLEWRFDQEALPQNLISSAHLFPVESENDVINQKEYASIIGSLRYVTDCTRPDIAYAVGVLSKFTSKPASEEANWLRDLLFPIPYFEKPIPPILIHYDSTALIGRVQNHYYNDKSRPIRIKHSNVRSYLTNDTINVDYVKSCDNLADLLTKALAREKVRSTSRGMGLKPIET
ncbi:Linoleate 13S-lipoxygenase 2-1, chloroplastic [Capsicum chinense]|nr:Linoleate 13S-lipoxygenase 2-1, chloroplastic [Capsicum chinense]